MNVVMPTPKAAAHLLLDVFEPVDFARIAEGRGLKGLRITRSDECAAVLVDAVVDAAEPMLPPKRRDSYVENMEKALRQMPAARREIEAIHAKGLKAWVYTVDDPARARQLIAAGIDGIITNVPAQMIQVRSGARH